MTLSHKLIKITLGMMTFGLSLPVNAQAKIPLAKFSLQLPIMKYTTSSTKTSSQSQESSTGKSTQLSTQVLDDGFIGMSFGKLAFYIYPFFDGNNFVSAGYMITDSIELGADLGLNYSSDQDTTGTRDSTLIGGWGYHYMSIGAFGLENGLSIGMTNKTVGNPPAADTKSKELSIKASAGVTYPIARNLRYIGGVFIRHKDLEIEGGAKTSTFQVGLILAGLRLKWL